MPKKSIFISGIHGVGKTTFSKQLENIIHLPLYSASTLIKQQNSALEFPEKKIQDVAKNQDVLLQAIENFVSEEKFILDGHFTLQKENCEIVKVPLRTFEQLSPDLMILLLDDPVKIQQRINIRNDIFFEQEFLRNMQEAELRYSQELSNHLNIPLICLNGFSAFELFLKSAIKGVIEDVYN